MDYKAKIIKNQHYLVVLGIVLFAFVLRFVSIDIEALWRDEAFSVNVASTNVNNIFDVAASDTQPPLHLLLLSFWISVFGDSEISVRFLSLIFGMLLFVPAFAVSKPRKNSLIFKNNITQYTFLGLLALSPVLIKYSQEARVYSILQFSFLSSLIFLLRSLNLIESKNLNFIPRIHIPFIFFVVLGLYSHNLFLLITLGYGLVFVKKYLEIKKTNYKKFISLLLYIFFPIGGLFLPWLGVLINQYNSISEEGFWLEFHPILSPIIFFMRAFFGEYVSEKFALSIPIISFLIGISFVLIIFGMLKSRNKDKDYLNIFFIILGVIYIFSFFTPLIYVRYLSFLVPLLFIFFVIGLNSITYSKIRNLYLIITFVLLFALQSIYILNTNKYDYREVFNEIDTLENDLVLNADVVSFHSTRYYLGNINYVYDPREEAKIYHGTAALEEGDYFNEDFSNVDRVWSIGLYGNNHHEELEKNGFRFVEEYRDRELRVHLYRR